MSRRVNLPGAAELFRSTEPAAAPAPAQQPDTQHPDTQQPESSGRASRRRRAPEPEAGHTGRVKHDEKFTVYVSSAELLALEQARLDLRASHGVAADRGRIVRAAIAQALADLAEHGDRSELVTRLRER